MNYNWPTIGHSKQKQYLQKQIESGKISHAYLFVGAANLGKLEIANFFVQSILCTPKQGADKPCGKCENCRQFKKKIHPDFYLVDPFDKKKKTMSITVEQVRGLIKNLSTKASSKSHRIALVDQAQTMNIKAANALLKTLEEPGKNQVIILLTESVEHIPETIISRCQVLKFLPVSRDQVADELISLKIMTDRNQAQELANISNGYPQVAINYANKPKAFVNYKEKVEWSADFFLAKTLAAKISMLDQITKRKNENNNIKELLDTWVSLWRDVLLVKHNQNNLVVNTFVLTQVQALEEDNDAKQIQTIIKKIQEVSRLEQSMNWKLWIENLIINL